MATRTSLALLGLLAACATAPPATPPAPPPPPEPEPGPTVLGESEILVLAELLRMEDVRRIDTARVARLLRDPSPTVRSRAVLAAARVGDRRMTPALMAALGDSVGRVRADAAFALGVMADSAPAVVAALVAAAERDTQGERATAAEAAAALGRIATPVAASALGRLLASYASAANAAAPPPMDAPGHEALLAAARLPDVRALYDAIAPHTAAADAETRWRAVYVLSRRGAPGHLAVLLDRVDDPDARVRTHALRGLIAPIADTAGLRSAARDVLLRGLEDVHPHVRIAALTALGTYAEPGLVGAVAARLEDPDANVRVAAAQALGGLGRAAAGPLGRLAGDRAAHVALRAAALASLVRVDAALGAGAATGWIDERDWLLRLHAVRSLGAAGRPLGEPGLLRLARDADPLVATAALRSLAAAADTGTLPYPLLLERLAASEPRVRAAAAAALGTRPREADLAPLMEAYNVARRDADPAAALAVVDALAAIARLGLPVATSFALRFPKPENAEVHRRVARHFGRDVWGEPPPTPAPRADAFYVDAVRRLVAPVLTGGEEPRVAIGTPHGEILLELAGADAPLTVRNFLDLIDRGYYRGGPADGSPRHRWHRVVPNFVLQDGDPRGDGSGEPGHTIRDEINRLRYDRGVLGMALSGPDTGGGQFFITHSPQPHLDGGYTVFGRVAAGMEAADRVVQEDAILFIRRVR
jgi:cyclophilin family peptidyl-prolyl cis-trans isomerase/HEAT repeat protein